MRLRGGIVAAIEDAMRFIERNMRTAWRIDGLQRKNISEYLMRALREAITNAVMHRDWFMDGANVFVELYTDRIEISSPGGLPTGMTLADRVERSLERLGELASAAAVEAAVRDRALALSVASHLRTLIEQGALGLMPEA
jgi:predicted HTH transcriptional regulator